MTESIKTPITTPADNGRFGTAGPSRSRVQREGEAGKLHRETLYSFGSSTGANTRGGMERPASDDTVARWVRKGLYTATAIGAAAAAVAIGGGKGQPERANPDQPAIVRHEAEQRLNAASAKAAAEQRTAPATPEITQADIDNYQADQTQLHRPPQN